ncbi:MAG: FkbM family methyltransferase [Cyanobacteria bacterium P01_F01_bin.143]
MKEKFINLKIGDKKYQIVSDDDYLPQMRSGLKSSIINLIKTLINQNGFEPKMVKLFQTLIKDDDLVMDIGANIGCTSILFGELADQVISFEPSPTTFNLLQKNIQQSGLENITLHNYALGSSNITSQITYSPANRSGGFISNKTRISTGHVTEKIEARRLDDIIDNLEIQKIDFIKIDVEGFEKEVIEGARNAIERFRPIIVLELNHWCLNAFQRITIPDFFDYLQSIFPILYAVEGDYYADLYDERDRYKIMYNHIINFKFSNIVAAFEQEQLIRLLANYHQDRS